MDCLFNGSNNSYETARVQIFNMKPEVGEDCGERGAENNMTYLPEPRLLHSNDPGIGH